MNAPIYQPADQLGRTITGLDLTGEGGRPVPRQTEAYHWGEMTSGGWRKAVWALLGLMPAMMFVTGAVMWWQRVMRKRPVRVEAVGTEEAA